MARHFWGRDVFVLVISNINIGFQKSLTPPLSILKCKVSGINLAALIMPVCRKQTQQIPYFLLFLKTKQTKNIFAIKIRVCSLEKGSSREGRAWFWRD